MKTTVLLIEDSETTRYALAYALASVGYDVTEAENLKKAMELMAIMKFDWVMCDNHLPDGLGVNFLQEIAQAYPETNRILMSAGSDPGGHNARFIDKLAGIKAMQAMIQGVPQAVPQ